MLIKEPNVRLIDYTGKQSDDEFYAARKLIFTKKTRLEQTPETEAKINEMDLEELFNELEYAKNSVRSSWEFVTFTFAVNNVSRGFTHQMVRTRTASYAQQSQRVVDMSGFDYTCGPVIENDPDMLMVYNDAMVSINYFYKKLIAMGAPAQDARGVLPTAVGTSIIVEMNLRTLADLAGKRDNPRAEGEYFKVFKQMANVVCSELPWVFDFLYPERKSTPSLDAILKEMRGDFSPVGNELLNDAMKELDKLKGTWG